MNFDQLRRRCKQLGQVDWKTARKRIQRGMNPRLAIERPVDGHLQIRRVRGFLHFRRGHRCTATVDSQPMSVAAACKMLGVSDCYRTIARRMTRTGWRWAMRMPPRGWSGTEEEWDAIADRAGAGSERAEVRLKELLARTKSLGHD